MKKLNMLICFLCLAFVSSQAAIIEVAPADARMTTMIIGGQTAVTDCPPWYADSNVIFSWNGAHPDGHNTGCENDGTTRLADTDTATTIETSPCSAANPCIELDDSASVGEYLRWDQEYLDGSDAAQTICLEVYSSEIPTSTMTVFYAGDFGDDMVKIFVTTGTSRMQGYFFTQAGPDPTAYGATLGLDSWETIGYSWNVVGAATDHSANPGDFVTWPDGWEDDNGEVTSDMTDASVQLRIGNTNTNAMPVGEFIYIGKMALVTGYKFDCSTLTEW